MLNILALVYRYVSSLVCLNYCFEDIVIFCVLHVVGIQTVYYKQSSIECKRDEMLVTNYVCFKCINCLPRFTFYHLVAGFVSNKFMYNSVGM